MTGTPIQNDLKEFFTLADFCNPGVLGMCETFVMSLSVYFIVKLLLLSWHSKTCDLILAFFFTFLLPIIFFVLLGNQSSFHKVYESPILQSKQPNCTSEEKRIGEERAKELNRITSSFILRRTSDVNQKYLPPKS